MRGAFHGDGRAQNIGYRGSIALGALLSAVLTISVVASIYICFLAL
jgi:hypothetical protein